MIIAVGCDHRGCEMLDHLTRTLQSQGHQIVTHGQPDQRGSDYPDAAYPVAMAVATGAADRGVLIDGTGIGMCIAANKIKGIRAALVHDEIGADMAARHNNANILCLPGDLLGMRVIDGIIATWLNTPFEAGRHARRVSKINMIENGQDPRATASEMTNDQ